MTPETIPNAKSHIPAPCHFLHGFIVGFNNLIKKIINP